MKKINYWEENKAIRVISILSYRLNFFRSKSSDEKMRKLSMITLWEFHKNLAMLSGWQDKVQRNAALRFCRTPAVHSLIKSRRRINGARLRNIDEQAICLVATVFNLFDIVRGSENQRAKSGSHWKHVERDCRVSCHRELILNALWSILYLLLDGVRASRSRCSRALWETVLPL